MNHAPSAPRPATTVFHAPRSILVALVACSLLLVRPAAAPQQPTLEEVLQKAGTVVAQFERIAAELLADEKGREWIYERQPGGALPHLSKQRKWTGELALIRTPATAGRGYPWFEFRDIVTLDGRALPGRQGRLQQLYLKGGDWTAEKAASIALESAKYNLGPILRNLNTPALGLLMLHPTNQARFRFRQTGTEKIKSRRCWTIDFEEQASPTLITGPEGSDCAATGQVAVDPTSGDVLRSEVTCGQRPAWWTTTAVTYEPNDSMGLCLPVSLLERAVASGGKIWSEGEMRYSNYRRFQTKARILPPR